MGITLHRCDVAASELDLKLPENSCVTDDVEVKRVLDQIVVNI